MTGLKKYVKNRHIAAHGAFFGSENGYLRVDYVENIAARKQPVYVQNRTAITNTLVTEAIEDADRIYSVLLNMLEDIKPNLFTEALLRIVPIVEHPQE